MVANTIILPGHTKAFRDHQYKILNIQNSMEVSSATKIWAENYPSSSDGFILYNVTAIQVVISCNV